MVFAEKCRFFDTFRIMSPVKFLVPAIKLGTYGHPCKHLCNAWSIEKQRESEAPAELAPPWFVRSLTLPSNELVG